MFTALAIAALVGLAPTDTPIEPIEESTIVFATEGASADEQCNMTHQLFPLLTDAIGGDPLLAEDLLLAVGVVAFEQGWNQDNAPGEPTGRMTLEAQEAYNAWLRDCMRFGA